MGGGRRLVVALVAVVAAWCAGPAAATVGSSAYGQAVLADAPVGYWRLGEASGTTVFDDSVNGHDGTYFNGVALGVPGALTGDADTAAGFDGVNDYADITNSPALDITAPALTVELWTRAGPQAIFATLLSKSDFFGTMGYSIYVSGTGRLQFWIGGPYRFTTDFPFTWDNEWHHVVGTYDGVQLRLYVDGIQKVGTPTTGPIGDSATRPLRLGQFSGGGFPYKGALDEVAVYDHVLSPERIRAHYDLGRPSAAAIELTRVYTDPYDRDAFRPGRDNRLHATFIGSIANADLYVDGALVSTGIAGGDFDWHAPADYTAHTLVLRGRDAAGNDVTSNELTLKAIVSADDGIVSFLSPELVADNPFSTDGDVPLPAYPLGAEGFRQRQRVVLEAKSNGTAVVEPRIASEDHAVGQSYYCDDPSHEAQLGAWSIDAAPVPVADGSSVGSFLQSRVDVEVPMVFDVADAPEIGSTLQEALRVLTSGRTGDTPLTPWIFTRLTETVTPAGPAAAWQDGASLVPLHYLYLEGHPVAGPLPVDVAGWLQTAPLLLLLRQVVDVPSELSFFGSDFYFKALRAECARRRMEASDPLRYFVLHHSLPELPWWLRLGLAQDVFLHFNRHEVDQGVARRGFVRDEGCLIPFCSGGPETLYLFHSPVEVHVEGPSLGPEVTQEVIGHTTLVITPTDPAYHVSFVGTGEGVVSIDVQQFEAGHRVLLEQFADVPIVPGDSGTVELEGEPLVRLNGAALEPSVHTTSEQLETTDATPPVTRAELAGTAGEPGYFRSAVTVRLVPTDDLSGIHAVELSLDGGTSWQEYTKPVRLEADGTYALAFRSTDRNGNREPARTATVVIDTVAPSISVASPTETTYVLGSVIPAAYTCSDERSGIASCSGPVAPGGAIDTGSVGTLEFVVEAVDRAGNSAAVTVRYAVTYGICLLYDANKPRVVGSTVVIELRLCDAAGTDVSSPLVALTAVAVVAADGTSLAPEDAGNANPGGLFRFDGVYTYNLSTRALTPGTWALRFTAAGDPALHDARFVLRN